MSDRDRIDDEEPLAPDDAHEVLAVARDQGADLTPPWAQQAARPRRPGAEEVPTPADYAVAQALYAMRPAALPWAGLARPAHRNLAIDAMRLRRVLIAQGWTPPTKEADHA